MILQKKSPHFSNKICNFTAKFTKIQRALFTESRELDLNSEQMWKFYVRGGDVEEEVVKSAGIS